MIDYADPRMRRYSAVFKQNVADYRLAGRSINATARRFGVNRESVRAWTRLAAAGALLPDDRIRRLELKIAELRAIIKEQDEIIEQQDAKLALVRAVSA